MLPDVLSEESIVWQQYNTTTDGYLIVGSFNGFGLAEGTVDNRIGKLRELRLHVHSESENWVILSEVSCNEKGNEIEAENFNWHFRTQIFLQDDKNSSWPNN